MLTIGGLVYAAGGQAVQQSIDHSDVAVLKADVSTLKTDVAVIKHDVHEVLSTVKPGK